MNCNEINQTAAELKMKFEAGSILSANDLDLLVELTLSARDCSGEVISIDSSYYKEPLETLTNLTNLNYLLLEDNQRHYVKSENKDYFWNATATSGDYEPFDKGDNTLGFWVATSYNDLAGVPTSQPQSFIDNLVNDLATIEAKRIEENNKISGTDEINLSSLTTIIKNNLIGAINENKSKTDSNKSDIDVNTANIAGISGGEIYAIPRVTFTPSTEPSPTKNGNYRAEAGTYTNWGGTVIPATDGVIYSINVSDVETAPIYKVTFVDLNLEFDETPTVSSTKPVQSGGVADTINVEKARITQEITDRENADATLQFNIDILKQLQQTTANKALSYVVQKFDITAITDDVRTVQTGATSANTDYFTTDFMPYSRELEVAFYGFRKDEGGFLILYNSDFQVVGGNNNPISGLIYNTSNNDARWIKLSLLKKFKDTLQVLIGNKLFFPTNFLLYNESETMDENSNEFIEEQNSNKNYDIFENKYDKTNFIPDTIVNQTNGITQSITGRNTTHFIDVKAGYYIKISGTTVTNYAFSRTVSEIATETAPNNIAQSFDSGASNAGSNTLLLTPQYATKFRFSFDENDNNNVMVFIGSAKGVVPTVPLDYLAFGTKLKTLKTNLLPTDAFKSTMYEQTRNAVIFKGIKTGSAYNVFNGDIVDSPSECRTTIGRRVEGGDILRMERTGYGEFNSVGVYTDMDGNYVGGHLFNGSNLTDTAPSGAKLFFYSFKIENILTKIITVNSEDFNYIKGEERLKIEFDPNNVRNLFKGIVIDFTGDSITAQERYIREIVNQLEIGWVKNAQGGQRLSGSGGMHITAFDDNDSKRLSPNSSIYTLNAGANDWGQNRLIGTSGSTDTETFLGALNSFVSQFYAEKPTKSLLIIGTTPSYKDDAANFPTNNGSGYVNNNGNTTRDFSDAMQDEVAILKSTYPHLHFVNTYQEFTDENRKIDFPDDIHPEEVGGYKMAKPIIKKMIEIVDNLETITV